MEIHVFKTPDETTKGVADFFVAVVNDSINKRGKCNLVLPGGNSPKKLFELLASPSYKNQINWQKVWFFFGDERYVPFTDNDNNGLMAKRSLFDPLEIEGSKIYYINTSFFPREAADDYEKKIKARFGENPCRFDLILLGLGENAHTASLFPYTSVIHESKTLVSSVYIDEINASRITMTPALLNDSYNIAFLVYGKNKAEAVYNILKGPKDIDKFPAQVINPKQGIVHWFLDAAAASML